MTIKEIGKQGNAHAVKNGFYGTSPKYEIHKKIREENTEFISSHCSDIGIFNEVVRDGINSGKIDKCKMFESLIKNSEGDELADILITVCSGAEELGIDLEEHVRAKLLYNGMRDDHK